MSAETTETSGSPYPVEPIVSKGELPDPFARPGGGRVASREEWPERAAA